MMRRLVLVSLMLLAVSGVNAMQDKKAKEILQKVSENTRSFESLSVDFIFTMENEEMAIHEENDGSIQLKGQKYLVNLPDIGIKVYSDGISIWNYMVDGNQVTISSVDADGGELMNPSSLFSIYEKGFNSEYVGEKSIEGKQFHEIELYPGEDEYDVSKVSLLIDKSAMMINSATLYGTDGNLYGIKINDMKTDVGLPDDYFEFNAAEYNDIEIIDFR